MNTRIPSYVGLARHYTGRALRSLSQYIDVSLLRPTRITLDITDRCQLKCPTCMKWKTPLDAQKLELHTEEWKSIILKMKHWLGEFGFIVSGGEPFLRKDILEIIAFSARNGLHTSLISNGFGFSSVAKGIVESGLESLRVSLNASSPNIHDATRGANGSFQKTSQFIEDVNLQRKRCGSQLRLSVVAVLMPSNHDKIIDLVEWVKDEGVDSIILKPIEYPGYFHSFYLQDISERTADSEWLQEIFGSGNMFDVILDELISYKQRGYPISNSVGHLKWMKAYFHDPRQMLHIKCDVGVKNFAIDPYGNARLCFHMKPIGNLLVSTPEILFNSKKAREQRQIVKKCSMLCARARYWSMN
jgi:MoaA/NifB/PqqE/SkfB family radical SAM enzyme